MSTPPHDPTRVKAAHRRVVVIVGAMLTSLFVYAVVVEMINRSGTIERGTAAPDAVRWVFFAVAVTMVFLSHLVKGFMLRGPRPAGADEMLARLTTAHIVAGALSETPAILGLVLFFLGRQFYSDFYILSLISLYLLMRHFPRYARWEQLLGPYAVDD